MRRALLLTAVAATLVLLWSSDTAAAEPIPGTPISVLQPDPATQKDVTFGSQTNFSWVVFNPSRDRYTLAVSANVTDPGFSVEVFPTNFSLPRDRFLVVRLNVTAPMDGGPRSTTIHVNFTTISPVASYLQVNATVVARRAPATIDALGAFVAIGGIIAIGFVAMLIFERTKIPDLLILIALGVLLGPVALGVFGVIFVPRGVLEAAAPYFAAVALMMILFDGGLNLPIVQVIRKMGATWIQTGFSFLGTMIAVAYVAIGLLGYDPLVGFLLGAVLGGTSSMVIIAVVRALQVGEDTKIVLTLESVLTDVLCVVAVIGIIELIRGGPGASVGIVFVKLAQAFFMALGIAFVFGIGWLFLLREARKKPFAYMLTIAMLFILYGVTESVGGSGAMASFVFGLILGNHEELSKRLRLKGPFIVDERIRQFHGELSFVIRAFFFVFLGLVVTFQFSGGRSLGLFLAGVAGIFLAITGVRIVTARITASVLHRPPEERRVLWSLMGRGLAAAVLASLPFTIPAFTAPVTPNDVYYQTVMAPYEIEFLNIVFFIIILTMVVTTFGAATYARAAVPAKPPVPTPRPTSLGFMSQLDPDELHTMETWVEQQEAPPKAPVTNPDGPRSAEADDRAREG